MCKYKDTTLGIKKIDFNVKRLTKAQRKDYMIMDDQYFSFDACCQNRLPDVEQIQYVRLCNRPVGTSPCKKPIKTL